jgi:hypothetical protein
MPQLLKSPKNTDDGARPVTVPKKFVHFAHHDSRAVESKYQKLLEGFEDCLRRGVSTEKPIDVKVPVEEDPLFDVDVAKREMAPAYWLGPVYEGESGILHKLTVSGGTEISEVWLNSILTQTVRRGSWFYPDGTSLRPCEESLAAQLEEVLCKRSPKRCPQLLI